MAIKAKHTTVDDDIVPGPIESVGTYMYQLDNTPGRHACNLWSGMLSANNGNEPRHVEKAVQLFKAAPDLLAALTEAAEVFELASQGGGVDFHAYAQGFRKAIAKANEPLY